MHFGCWHPYVSFVFPGICRSRILPIMAAYHAQACYAVMHRVVLKVEFKVSHLFYNTRKSN